jgi:hypothetical protein
LIESHPMHASSLSRWHGTRLLIACVWAGSLWTVGYLVAPTLFATLADRVLAGTIAASVFRVQAWVSIACAVLLAGLLLVKSGDMDAKRRLLLLRLVAGMMICTLLVHFGLQPIMAALRAAAPGGVMIGAARTQFGMLHGGASVIYLVQSLMAVVLVLKMR